jgi:hypothetical protein
MSYREDAAFSVRPEQEGIPPGMVARGSRYRGIEIIRLGMISRPVIRRAGQ